MANTDLAVRIATVLDATGLKKADKGIKGLDGTAKKLAKTMAATFSVAAITAFGKAAAKAFIDDEKEASRLAGAVKNLGMEFANPVIATYIDNLSKLSGVADGELRPALQTLIQQTGNLAKSQELLDLAISVSRGSGESLTTVTNDLAQAYVGNTRGLRKYYLGLTQAELKAISFTDVQEKLNKQFSGSNARYLATYAGQLQVLTVAAGEAQETIGKGLLDSLAILAGDGTVKGLADSMQDLAQYTSDVVYGLSNVVAQMKNLKAAAPSWLTSLLGVLSRVGPLGQVLDAVNTVANYGARKRGEGMQNANVQMFMTDQANQRVNNIAAKKAADAAKKISDATKKNTAELKKQAAAKKQSALFDLEKIGLVAALQGKITDEERLRLNLQLALLTGNDVLATKLSKDLANSIDSTGKLAKDLTTLPDAKNPFASWSAYLDMILEKARLAASFTSSGASSTRGASFAALNPTVQDLVTGSSGTASAGVNGAGNVYVTVNGSVVSDQDLVIAIENGLQTRSLSGSNSVIGRISGMFG